MGKVRDGVFSPCKKQGGDRLFTQAADTGDGCAVQARRIRPSCLVLPRHPPVWGDGGKGLALYGMPLQRGEDSCFFSRSTDFAGLFHGDGTGKDDVVFEMDVMVQTFFEEFGAFHEEPPGGAAIVRGGVSPGQAVDFTPALSFRIVFGHHDGNRAFDGAAME